MNTFTESIWDAIRQHGWKYRVRGTPIMGALVHATRSGFRGRTSAQEYSATKNWFRSPNNRTIDSAGNVSAGMTHAIIGDGGKLCICLPDEMYPTWSAGHMDIGGLWSVELAQATNGDPYHPLDLERAEHEIAKKLRQYGLPAKCIDFMDGANNQRPGVAFHDASRNGQLLGKSDPGTQSPFNDRQRWVREKITPLVTGDDPMTDQEREAFEELVGAVVKLRQEVNEFANATDAVVHRNDVEKAEPPLSPKGLYYIARKRWPF